MMLIFNKSILLRKSLLGVVFCLVIGSCCLGVTSDIDCDSHVSLQFEGFNAQELAVVQFIRTRHRPNLLDEVTAFNMTQVSPNSSFQVIDAQSDLELKIIVPNTNHAFEINGLKIHKETCRFCSGDIKKKEFEFNVLDSLVLNGNKIATPSGKKLILRK